MSESSARVAKVALEVNLPHLDRLFDYSIPGKLADLAHPGVRVRVRFAGRLVSGFIVEVGSPSEPERKLTPLSKIPSGEAVLSAQQYQLCRSVADYYAGSTADVLRLAVPPRHAATEQAAQHPWPEPQLEDIPGAGLSEYPNGSGWLAGVRAGHSLRACWQFNPGFEPALGGWRLGLAQAMAATMASGRGVIAVLPDVDKLRVLADALTRILGPGWFAQLHSGMGVSARYRNYLALSRGNTNAVIGTRGAVFAPVHNLGLVIVLDDGDDLLDEPRAPYPQVRQVAAIRAVQEGCGLLFASASRSTEVQAWVESGWIAPIQADARVRHQAAALIRVAGDSDQSLDRDPMARSIRVPRLAFETIRTGLASGPVLIQVPRAGYLAALSCARCRTPVRCRFCHGPVRANRQHNAPGGRTISDPSSTELVCGWCGRVQTDWSCPVCGSRTLRAPVIGSGRTAEEFGRAFPGYRLIESAGDHVVEQVGTQPAIVVATPGGEPVAEAGYSAAVFLDASLALGRASVRAGEEALRRWLNATALVRSAGEGGSVCVVGPSEDRVVQALVRLDPAGYASRELAERGAAGFPPAVRFATMRGDPAALAQFSENLKLPQEAELLGPVPVGGPVRSGEDAQVNQLIARCPIAFGHELSTALKAAEAARSARKLSPVRVQVDPPE